jgi:FMN phosphatase YigB (HAD superfamily)
MAARQTPGRIKAVLFDLDDTLLINETEQFMTTYFRALLAYMRKACDPQRLIEALQVGTRAMMDNDGTHGTNAEVFRAQFVQRLDGDAATVLPLLESFYEREFDGLRGSAQVDPAARAAVAWAFQHGYQVAVATQPLFPLAGIRSRLRWADVPAEEFPYDLITSYEVMSACKPHPAYFRQVLEHLGRAPQECLMVGDSFEADMPARKVGMRTFWVDRGRRPLPPVVPADAWGDLADLLNMMQSGEIDGDE